MAPDRSFTSHEYVRGDMPKKLSKPLTKLVHRDTRGDDD
jgi:hypothetical protein